MHPTSCQLFSGTQQLVVQAHVPIFYSCGVIHMHLAMHRKVTQADADSCIRPSTYCCCIDSSKMLAHRGVHTPVTVTCVTPVTGLVQAPGPCGDAPPPDESRASSESTSRRMCTTHTSRHADASSGGPLMEASPTCSSVYMNTCTRRCSDPMDHHRVPYTASSTLWISLCIKGRCTDE